MLGVLEVDGGDSLEERRGEGEQVGGGECVLGAETVFDEVAWT